MTHTSTSPVPLRSLVPTVIRAIVTVAIALAALVATAAVALYALLVIDSRESVRHYYGDTPNRKRLNTGLNRHETRK